MKLLALGGPLNGQMIEMEMNGSMVLSAKILPESWKQVLVREAVDYMAELRMLITRYRPYQIGFDWDGLHLRGRVWLWEELDGNDPELPRLALAHVLSGAMKP